MINRVASGDYAGRAVCCFASKPFIALARGETIDISADTVTRLSVIGTDRNIDVPNAAMRGFMGEMLFGPIGVAAAATSAHKESNRIAIEFKDGKSCVLKVDEAMRELIERACAGQID